MPRNQTLLPFDDAVATTLGLARRLPAEAVPLLRAQGRVLRGDVKSRITIPPFDKSAMDGYAVRVADVAEATARRPAVLPVVEDLPAGRRTRRRLAAGTAARIMTGAPLPPGAEAVVMQEDTDRAGDQVRIARPVTAGQNCGRAGEDVRRGDVVVFDGTVLGPAELGMIAATGRDRVKVTRQPRVAVLSTGDEVTRPGGKLAAGKIFDANGYSLVGLARRVGAAARFLGIARDRPGALESKLARAADAGADVILLSGGVSVGDHDLVREQLTRHGFREVFWRVAMKPGKPSFLGRKGRRVVFGLPGNPVSVMVCFELLVRPYLQTLLGLPQVGLPRLTATLTEPIARLRGPRRKFLRGHLDLTSGTPEITPYRNQKSGVLRSMVDCNALIDVPGEATSLATAATVTVLPLEAPWPS